MMYNNGKPIEEIMKELAEPFKPDEIEWRVGSTNKDKTKGIALAYVTNRAIMNRLDSVVGAFNWQNEFIEWKKSLSFAVLASVTMMNGYGNGTERTTATPKQ